MLCNSTRQVFVCFCHFLNMPFIARIIRRQLAQAHTAGARLFSQAVGSLVTVPPGNLASGRFLYVKEKNLSVRCVCVCVGRHVTLAAKLSCERGRMMTPPPRTHRHTMGHRRHKNQRILEETSSCVNSAIQQTKVASKHRQLLCSVRSIV